jgi:hypothetical protein
MARVFALASHALPAPMRELRFELVRVGIVCGCSLALISAGRALPF